MHENSAAKGSVDGKSISFSEIVMDQDVHLNETNEIKFFDHFKSPLENLSPGRVKT